MKPTTVARDALVALALCVAAWLALTWLVPAPAPPAPPPRPVPAPAPQPCPGPGPCPVPPPRKPWGPRSAPVGAFVSTYPPWDQSAVVAGPRHADGSEIDCHLPNELHQKNTGGSDGAGLCVFASMRHSGLWCDEPVFTGLFEWMRKHPGGGYPEKVSKMVAAYARERGLQPPQYVQVESNDLEVLKIACQSGLMPGVTYAVSPTGRYGGQRIAHMVSLVSASDKWFVILDNNYPGTYEWMTPQEFPRSYGGMGGRGWAVIPLKPGAPPAPRGGA